MGGAVFHKGQHAPRLVSRFLERVVLGLIGLACAAREIKFIEFMRLHDALLPVSEHAMAAGHAADDVLAEPLPRHVARRMGIISDAHAHLVADTLATTDAYLLQVVEEI
jgi:hypothetical protein